MPFLSFFIQWRHAFWKIQVKLTFSLSLLYVKQKALRGIENGEKLSKIRFGMEASISHCVYIYTKRFCWRLFFQLKVIKEINCALFNFSSTLHRVELEI